MEIAASLWRRTRYFRAATINRVPISACLQPESTAGAVLNGATVPVTVGIAVSAAGKATFTWTLQQGDVGKGIANRDWTPEHLRRHLDDHSADHAMIQKKANTLVRYGMAGCLGILVVGCQDAQGPRAAAGSSSSAASASPSAHGQSHTAPRITVHLTNEDAVFMVIQRWITDGTLQSLASGPTQRCFPFLASDVPEKGSLRVYRNDSGMRTLSFPDAGAGWLRKILPVHRE